MHRLLAFKPYIMLKCVTFIHWKTLKSNTLSLRSTSLVVISCNSFPILIFLILLTILICITFTLSFD
jgi:hypothetical protein